MAGAGKLELVEKPDPCLKDGYAIVKIMSVGICGSDVSAYKGGNPTVRYPIDGIGHEGVGYISEIGENDANLKVGDRVALEPFIPDMECHECREEKYNNCEHLKVAGVHTDGMMCDYYSIPIRFIHKIPDSLSFHRAALVEPLTIGLHGAFRAGVEKGDVVAITGAGPIGMLASFGVLSKGAIPVIMDVNQERLDYARSIGLPYAFNNSNGGFPEYQEERFGHRADAMIECTGSPFIHKEMHDYVRHGATIALVGWPKEPVVINTVRCMQKEINIHPSRNSNKLFPESIRLISEGFVPVDKMTSKIISLDEVEETIKDMIQNPGSYIKVVVDVNEE